MEYIEKMETITAKSSAIRKIRSSFPVRSGARASMPGMMDTILNLGLNEEVVNIIAEKSNNPRWAWDCYRRFIQMYPTLLWRLVKSTSEQLIDAMKEKRNALLRTLSLPQTTSKSLQAVQG